MLGQKALHDMEEEVNKLHMMIEKIELEGGDFADIFLILERIKSKLTQMFAYTRQEELLRLVKRINECINYLKFL